MESSYEELRSRWRQRLEESTAGHGFGAELSPGKFYVLYSDIGNSGGCCSEAWVVGVFDDARDFLGFVRHAELPRILDYATSAYRDVPNVAYAYLLGLEEELRNKVDWLLGLIDRALKRNMIESQLPSIWDAFNTSFEGTNPSVRILAIGTLADILASDHFEEEFEEAKEEELDEDQRPVTTLKNLLDAEQFDENDGEDLALARGFLERSMSFY